MKRFQHFAIPVAVVAACFASAAHAAPEAKIGKIFTHRVIGANVARLEKITGKPVAIDKKAGTRSYKVGACKVTAYMQGRRAASLELETSPQCTFDLSKITGSAPKGTLVHELTYGKAYTEFGEGRFTADCLEGCSATPTIGMTWEGPHSDKFLQFLLQTELTDKNAKDAAEKWAQHMREKSGTEYVKALRFNTENTYDEAAAKMLQGVAITRIRAGHGIVKEE